MTTFPVTSPVAAGLSRSDARYRTTVWAIGAALLLLAVVQALALPMLDPVRSTVSALVFAPGGQWIFPVACVCAVVGAASLMSALASARRFGAMALMAVWAGGLTVATIFPTDPPGVDVLSLAANIHRWSAAVMFAALPIAGFLAAAPRTVGKSTLATLFGPVPRGSAAARVRRLSAWCAAIGITMLVVQLPRLMPDSSVVDVLTPAVAIRGLVERVLFVSMLGLVVAMARNAAVPEESRHVTARSEEPRIVIPAA